jgi:hypothetical protein
MIVVPIAEDIILMDKLPDMWKELDECWALLCKLNVKEERRRLAWSRLTQKLLNQKC